ncbi:MAG: hypothetical protein HZC28_12245 [Spirochaetes bacterium]|nr:hypothetical protein [Spirochaetota bacterium]
MGLTDKKALTDEELKAVLTKLRDAYAKNALEHGPSLFNLDAFNVRYLEALRKRIDLKVFFAAEIKALEDIKGRIAKKREDAERETAEAIRKDEESFSRKADAMLDRFEKMIEKYPDVKLTDTSSLEMNRLYGGLKELFSCYSIVKNIFAGYGDHALEMATKSMDAMFARYALDMGGRHPEMFQDYIIAFSRENKERETERMAQIVLKESGLFLHTLIDHLTELLVKIDGIHPGDKVELDELFERDSPRVFRSFSGKTKEEVVRGTLAYAQAMIRDFRLQSFKKQ